MEIASWFKWAGTFVTLIGAVLTTLAIDPINIYFLNIGSILFLIWAFLIKDKAMIAVNAGLLTIYIIGVTIRM
jgi:hypothetical protein